MKRAALIAPAIALRRGTASCSTRATSTCCATATDDFRKDRADRGDLPQQAASRSRPASGWCRRTSRRRCAPSATHGADGFYKGAVGAAIVASSQAGKGIITQADLDQYRTRELRAGRVRLPRLPHRLGAAAELGRRRHLRDPEHPRGLSAEGLGLPLGAGGALPDRGDAPRLRRPQQLPRRPRLREEPARSSARQGLRREDPRRDRPEEGRRLEGASSPASRRTKAATRRTTRSSTSAGNAVSVTYTLNDWFGAKVTAARHRRAAQRRDGRLHREDRRAQPVRPGAGRGERDRAGQAAAELDEPDHRHARTASR